MTTKKSDIENTEVTNAEVRPQKVRIMIPFVEGQAPDLTVGVNGVFTKIKKGVPVEVDPPVAQVIANSNQQMMEALETRRKFKNQRTDL